MPQPRNIYVPVVLIAFIGAACLSVIFWGRGSAAPVEETEAGLRATLQSKPADPLANEHLAMLLAKQGQYDQAIPFYEAAIKNAPDNATAPCGLAAALVAAGRGVEAQRVLEQSLKLHPNDATTNEALADMAVKSLGELAYPRVQPLYQIALKNQPQRPAAALGLAKIEIAQNRLSDATATLQKALQYNPRNAQLHLQLANVLALQYQYDAAAPHYDTATALDPKNAEAFCTWGVMLIDAGKPRAAETVLRKALEINNVSAIYHMHLGRALRDQGEFTPAMKEFEAALDRDKTYAPLYLEISQTLLTLHDEPAAEKFLRDALVVNRQFVEGKIALARLLTNASDPARRNLWEAADLLRQAVDDTHGQDLSLLVAHAAALARLELFDQAADQIDKGIALAKTHPLTAAQSETLRLLRQTYFTASLPSIPGNSSIFSVDGMSVHDPLDDPFPSPKQPTVKALVDRPLDITHPPARGSALDPDLHAAAATFPSPRRDALSRNFSMNVSTPPPPPAKPTSSDAIPYKIAVLVYIFNDAGKLLLLHRKKPPNKNLYSPIGGKLEQHLGESPYACALREIEEEIGIRLTLEDIRLLGIVSERAYTWNAQTTPSAVATHQSAAENPPLAAHWLMFCFKVIRPLNFPARDMNEGRLEWIDPADLSRLSIPKTDRDVIWPLVNGHSPDGFFSVHIDCTDADQFIVTYEHPRPPSPPPPA